MFQQLPVPALLSALPALLWLAAGPAGAAEYATACYADPAAQCYRVVEKRGRTLGAIHRPHRYKPLRRLTGAGEFERAWSASPGYVLAGLAHAAYLPEAEIAAMVTLFGGQSRYFDDRGRQAFLAVWPERAVLAFRGTQSLAEIRDMRDNLRADRVPFHGSRAHRGFKEAATELWDTFDLGAALTAMAAANPGRRLYVTGHSLGGAMAVIAAMLFPFDALVTFGQPMAGTDIAPAIAPGVRYLRVVNGADNVTTLPPAVLGYNHAGEVVRLKDEAGPSAAFGITFINTDHSIINYTEVLRRNPAALPPTALLPAAAD